MQGPIKLGDRTFAADQTLDNAVDQARLNAQGHDHTNCVALEALGSHRACRRKEVPNQAPVTKFGSGIEQAIQGGVVPNAVDVRIDSIIDLVDAIPKRR